MFNVTDKIHSIYKQE